MNVLGEESGTKFAQSYDITSEGNFEGVNIPNLLKSNDLESDFSNAKRKLYDYRNQRTSLHLDDKILLSWNSMMIAAMSMLYRISHEEKYRELAEKQIAFLSEQAADSPFAHSLFLLSKLLHENPPEHITIVMDEINDLSEIRTNLPFLVNITVVSESEKYSLLNNKTTYYVCKNHLCLPPSNEYTLK